MSRAEIVNAVVAKHEAPAGAEPAPDAAVAPPGGASGAGSASADAAAPAAEQPGGAPASPEAPTTGIDHDVLRAKLAHDRAARRAKADRKRAREEADKATSEREAAEKERAKWQNIGKDKSWLEAVKEAGLDPRKAYEEMQAEARRAGTPEAQLEAMGKAWEAKLSQWESEKLQPLQKTLDEITKERDQLREQTVEQAFEGALQRGLAIEKYQPLLDEYDPPQLLHYAKMFRDDPKKFHLTARDYKVPLTGGDGQFTMIDILNVLHAVQAAHVTRVEQRRTQRAAPQTSQASPQQPPQAKPLPVNGTVERNAATTIGNDLAASSATEADKLKGMSRQARVAYLAKKYG